MSEIVNLIDSYVTEVEGTITKFIRVEGLGAVGIAFFDTQEAAAGAFAGYNEVVGAIVAGTDATGLANDATVYTSTVTVDGVDQAVSIVGSAAQTVTTLITELNLDLTGVTATIEGSNIRITHDTAGNANQVSIVDVDLFSTALVGFVKVADPIGGGLTGLLQTTIYPTTGQYAWEAYKRSVEAWDTASVKAILAGADVASAGATYLEAEADAVVDMVNVLKSAVSVQ